MKWHESITGLPVIRRGIRWRWLCWLWGRIYRRWLWDDFYKIHWKPIQVCGWRSALCALGGYRRRITPCFCGLK